MRGPTLDVIVSDVWLLLVKVTLRVVITDVISDWDTVAVCSYSAYIKCSY